MQTLWIEAFWYIRQPIANYLTIIENNERARDRELTIEKLRFIVSSSPFCVVVVVVCSSVMYRFDLFVCKPQWAHSWLCVTSLNYTERFGSNESPAAHRIHFRVCVQCVYWYNERETCTFSSCSVKRHCSRCYRITWTQYEIIISSKFVSVRTFSALSKYSNRILSIHIFEFDDEIHVYDGFDELSSQRQLTRTEKCQLFFCWFTKSHSRRVTNALKIYFKCQRLRLRDSQIEEKKSLEIVLCQLTVLSVQWNER